MAIPVTELYNVPHEIPFGIIIVFFPFFTGLSAGSFVMSTLSNVFGLKKYKPIARISVTFAAIFLILAVLCLFGDLTRPERFWIGMTVFAPTSMFSLAGYLINGYLLLSIIYGYFIFTDNMKMAKIIGIIAIPIAIAVHANTGFVFGLNYGTPLWFTAIMPVLFVVSAILSGLAWLTFVLIIRNKIVAPEYRISEDIITGIGEMLAWMIGIELFLIFADLLTMFFAGAEDYEALTLLLSGPFAWSFLGLEIILGGMIPLLLIVLAQRKKDIKLYWLSAALVVIGVLAMRYNLVIGGLTIPKTGVGLIQYTPTMREIAFVAGLIVLWMGLMFSAMRYLPLDRKASPDYGQP